MFLIVTLVFLTVNSCNAFQIKLMSEGTSHLFTTDVIASNGLKEHWVDDKKAVTSVTYKMDVPDGATVHIKVNSRAWRDFGFFRYRWEKTGTTKEVDYTYYSHENPLIDYQAYFNTGGDTLFNGGNLDVCFRTAAK